MNSIIGQKKQLLLEDLEIIRKSLKNFRYFNFAGNLSVLMTEKNIDNNVLAERLKKTNTVITKWRFGEAYPENREQFKEIGLSLCMAEDELNYFLLSMGHIPLYQKNIFDVACISAIKANSDSKDSILAYRDYIKSFVKTEIKPVQLHKPVQSNDGQNELNLVDNIEDLDDWLTNHVDSFGSLAKAVLPNKELILYTTLFLGGASIGEMYQTGKLPLVIQSLLNPLAPGKEYFPRELRNKLIAFGLSKNMNDVDLDRLLNLARLRPFSNPETPIEAALLMAVRRAHLRFPIYEYSYLCDMRALLGAILKRSVEKEQVKRESAMYRMSYYSLLLDEVNERLETSTLLAGNYYVPGLHDDDDANFEEYYTSFSAEGEKCLANYVEDTMNILAEEGYFPDLMLNDFHELLQF